MFESWESGNKRSHFSPPKWQCNRVLCYRNRELKDQKCEVSTDYIVSAAGEAHNSKPNSLSSNYEALFICLPSCLSLTFVNNFINETNHSIFILFCL